MAKAKNNYNVKPLEDHVCQYCKNPIIIMNHKVRFCSDKCRVYYWRERNKRSDTKKKKRK